MQAAIIAGQPIDAILVDVTPYSLGIAIAEIRMGQVVSDRYKVLIHRNTTIPVTKEDVFYTMHPSQDTVEIKVYQGEKQIASQNTPLGDFLIEGLKAAIPGEQAAVTVSFDFDVDGILHVRAKDRHTGKEKRIQVEASLTRLAEDDVAKARARLEETAVEPLTDEQQALIDQAQALLSQDDLPEDSRTALTSLLSNIEIARAGDTDEDEFEELFDNLLDVLFDLE